jgi:hypothetical protein
MKRVRKLKIDPGSITSLAILFTFQNSAQGPRLWSPSFFQSLRTKEVFKLRLSEKDILAAPGNGIPRESPCFRVLNLSNLRGEKAGKNNTETTKRFCHRGKQPSRGKLCWAVR